MERGRGSVKRKAPTDNQVLVGQLAVRRILASYLGFQFGGDRDLYEALGYPTTIKYADYYARYVRQDIAKAVIDRPVKATWQGSLELLEPNTKEDTALEKAWNSMNKKFSFKTILSRVDRLTCIGEYGILLLGLDDVQKQEDWAKPISKSGTRSLKYLKPFSSNSAKINKVETNPMNERYGKPLLYDINLVDVAMEQQITKQVHYSRVIHFVNDPLESDVIGTPVLEDIYNRLMDLDKVVGGSGEMFWKGARPGFHGRVDKDYQMTVTTKTDLKDQLDEYEHGLRRFLVSEGIDLQALAQQIADPSKNTQVILQMISAAKGIPLRILTGSERGELASSEDREEWLGYVQSRRDEHADPYLLRLFIDRLIELKILPEPIDLEMGYSIKWSDLYALSEKQRVEIGKSRANAIREYTYNPIAQEVLPIPAFLESCLGFSSDQIELMESMRTREIKMEEDIIPEEEDESSEDVD